MNPSHLTIVIAGVFTIERHLWPSLDTCLPKIERLRSTTTSADIGEQLQRLQISITIREAKYAMHACMHAMHVHVKLTWRDP